MLLSAELRLKLTAKLAEAEKIGTDADKDITAKITNEINELMAQINAAEAKENAQRMMGGGESLAGNADAPKARNLGEHFVNHAKEIIKRSNGKENVSVPEFKNAVSDPHLTSDNPDFAQFATEYDRSQITVRKQAGILDLFPIGSTTNSAVTYFVKTYPDIATNRKGATTEGDVKNRRRYERTVKTDNAGKFTGILDMSREMVTDLDFVATEINNDLKNDVVLDAEYQLLNGDGSGDNIRGLLVRDGVLSVTSSTYEDNDKAIYSGINKVETITPFKVDSVIMHPEDYEALRLKKDANGQFVGGGMFQNQYGNGSLEFKPPVWTIERTVTSPFCPKGKVVVGAFNAGTKVLNLGGMTVDMTNANKDNFERNLLTFLAEQRVILQVKIPQCFCVINLASSEG